MARFVMWLMEELGFDGGDNVLLIVLAQLAEVLKGQPFQHGRRWAINGAVDTWLPFLYAVLAGGFFVGPRGCLR